MTFSRSVSAELSPARFSRRSLQPLTGARTPKAARSGFQVQKRRRPAWVRAPELVLGRNLHERGKVAHSLKVKTLLTVASESEVMGPDLFKLLL